MKPPETDPTGPAQCTSCRFEHITSHPAIDDMLTVCRQGHDIFPAEPCEDWRERLGHKVVRVLFSWAE